MRLRIGLLLAASVLLLAPTAGAVAQERQPGWLRWFRPAARAEVSDLPVEPQAPESPPSWQEPFDAGSMPEAADEPGDAAGEPAPATLRQRLRQRRVAQLERSAERLRRNAQEEQAQEPPPSEDLYMPPPPIDAAPEIPRELGLEIDFGHLQPPPLDPPLGPSTDPSASPPVRLPFDPPARPPVPEWVRPPVHRPASPPVSRPDTGSAIQPDATDDLPLEINIPLPDEMEEAPAASHFRDRFRGVRTNRAGS